ncbi:S-layer homology domain-containing protein [Candidatus Peregrinibacteria bacterium]|nr:MAG: S-layer homology domain-containing protein [Candidatus Peregrinibacteria bacterium]
MNIAHGIKRAIAAVSTFALVLTSSGVAIAQATTFQDVPSNAWFYPFVEDLVDQGVIAPNDFFYPNRSLNRAELMKIVVTANGGLFNYTAPATPTFSDVAPDAWYYDYVEAAVALELHLVTPMQRGTSLAVSALVIL